MTRTKVTVRDYKEKHCIRVDPEFAQFVPKVNLPMMAECVVEFSAENIGDSICNGIRRILASELIVQRMTIAGGFTEAQTDDDFLRAELIQSRIELIPIKQGSINRKFKIDVINNTPELRIVTTADIQYNEKVAPFNEMELFDLYPGRFFRANLEIVEHTARTRQYAGFTLASATASCALDLEPYNSETNSGILSAVAHPKKFKISFMTNGEVEPRALVKTSIDILIDRLRVMLRTLDNLVSSVGEDHTLHTPNNDLTIANIINQALFMKADKELKYSCVITNEGHEVGTKGRIYILIKMSEAPNKIISEAINECITIYEDIKFGLSK